MAKLSVIIPVYNVEKYLKECIDSVLNQSYKDIEIILIDDGSTDSSGTICDYYAQRDTRVRVLHKKNEGLVRARKSGVELVNSPYVTYVDSDDWIDSDMYETMMNEMLRTNADMACCAITKETSAGSFVLKNEIPSGYYDGDKLNIVKGKALYSGEYFKNGLFPAVWNKIYRLELLKSNQMRVNDVLRMGEDAMCTYSMLFDCSSVLIMNEIAPYHYRRMDATMSNSYDKHYFERIVVLMQELHEVFGKKSSYLIQRQLEFYQLYLIAMGIRQEFSLKRDGIREGLKKYRHLAEKYNLRQYINPKLLQDVPKYERIILNAFYHGKFLRLIFCIIFERFQRV